MVDELATLYLEGDVSLASYAQALTNFHRLLDALNEEVGRGLVIKWEVETLEGGSALTTVRATDSDEDSVRLILRAYESVGRSLAVRTLPPFSLAVTQPATELVELLDSDVRSLRFETQAEEFVVEAGLEAVASDTPQTPQPSAAYGAVEGRIQTLSNRGSLRFTLYDALEDRAVSCYLSEHQEDALRGLWGQRAVVEGWVRRDNTGRPITVRRVSNLSTLPELRGDLWQGARGAVRRPAAAPSAERAIRRLRDA